MNLISKKISSILLLIIIAAPLLLSAGFIINQKIAEHEMLEKLENASLQTFTIDQQDIEWIKKDKEIMIDGKLFDLKFSHKINHKIIITGLFDTKEDELKREYNKLINPKNNQSAPLNQLVLKLFLADIFYQKNYSILPRVSQSGKSTYLSFKEAAVSQYCVINTPPPNA